MTRLTDTAKDIGLGAYMKVISDATAEGRTSSVTHCRIAASEALLAALERGEIPADQINKEWADDFASRIDRQQTDAGRGIIKKVLDGQAVLADLLDHIVCPLGDGGRRFFADLNAEMLFLADKTRYLNQRAAAEEYNQWRDRIFDQAFPILQSQGCTFREAVEGGLIA